MSARIKQHIKLVMGHPEKERLIVHGKAESIGAGGPFDDLLHNPEVFGKLTNLSLLEMRPWLDI